MEPNYPIRLKVSPAALSELAACEEGAYEDAVREFRRGNIGDRDPRTHAHVVAQRYKSQLRIDNDAEAVDMYYAVCSGTFQVTEEKNFLHTARKIADWLRPIVERVSLETAKQFPQPDGY